MHATRIAAAGPDGSPSIIAATSTSTGRAGATTRRPGVPRGLAATTVVSTAVFTASSGATEAATEGAGRLRASAATRRRAAGSARTTRPTVGAALPRSGGRPGRTTPAASTRRRAKPGPLASAGPTSARGRHPAAAIAFRGPPATSTAAFRRRPGVGDPATVADPKATSVAVVPAFASLGRPGRRGAAVGVEGAGDLAAAKGRRLGP